MHIDWSTLALQTINVLVLVWLLARFLFRPVKTIIAERRAATEKLLADAAATRAQAEADAAEVRQRLQSASADAERMMAEARTEAEAERARLLQQAHDAAAHMQDESKAAIAIDRTHYGAHVGAEGLRPCDRHCRSAAAPAAGWDSDRGTARIVDDGSGRDSRGGAPHSGCRWRPARHSRRRTAR